MLGLWMTYWLYLGVDMLTYGIWAVNIENDTLEVK